jgi:hypothetical protein
VTVGTAAENLKELGEIKTAKETRTKNPNELQDKKPPKNPKKKNTSVIFKKRQ